MSLRGILSEMSFSRVDDGRVNSGGYEARSGPEYPEGGIVTGGIDEKKKVVGLVAGARRYSISSRSFTSLISISVVNELTRSFVTTSCLVCHGHKTSPCGDNVIPCDE